MADEWQVLRGRIIDLLEGSSWRRPPTRQRERQTFRYPKGTPAEALNALERVTSPDPSGRMVSGQPRMVSSADREEARRIFAGLRPRLVVRESVDPIHDTPLMTFKGKPTLMQTGERQRLRTARAEGSDPILPPVPASFTPSPLVVGTDTAKRFEELAAINPEIRRTLKSITTGPNTNFIRKILRENPTYLGYKRNAVPAKLPGNKSELGGQITGTYPDRQHEPYREMYLNPRKFDAEQSEWMGHEIGHMLLGGPERWPNRLQALLQAIPSETSNEVPGLTLRDILAAELSE